MSHVAPILLIHALALTAWVGVDQVLKDSLTEAWAQTTGGNEALLVPVSMRFSNCFLAC